MPLHGEPLDERIGHIKKKKHGIPYQMLSFKIHKKIFYYLNDIKVGVQWGQTIG